MEGASFDQSSAAATAAVPARVPADPNPLHGVRGATMAHRRGGATGLIFCRERRCRRHRERRRTGVFVIIAASLFRHCAACSTFSARAPAADLCSASDETSRCRLDDRIAGQPRTQPDHVRPIYSLERRIWFLKSQRLLLYDQLRYIFLQRTTFRRSSQLG